MSEILLKIFYIMAVPATVVLILQTVLLFFGIGDDGADIDGDCDGGFDCDDVPDDFESDAVGSFEGKGIRLFTMRGIIALLAVGGWAGVTALEVGAPWWLAIPAAALIGFLAMVLVAYCIRWALKLQSSGNIRYDNAVGLVGEVYMNIPANNSGKGKINVVVQERYTEIEAVTNADRELHHGEKVRVVGMADGNTVIVEAE